jgi:hypothetical protein
MKESAVQIARKQRHLHLLQKVKDNKALTPREVQELDGYEQKHAAAQAAAHPQSEPTLKMTEATVRTAGFECNSLAAAGERLGVADLDDLLEKKPKLAAAFARGRWLRQVRIVASKGIVAEEADRFFEPALARGELVERLKRDKALHEVWTSAALEAKLAVREGLIQRARRGEADVKVMELYERLLVEMPETGAGKVDWENLTPTQLDRATGINRTQWRRWERKNGCPRKANRRYSMPAVIEWLRQHEGTGGVKLERGLNPLQVEKRRREKLDNDEREGRLMETAQHEADILGRARHLAALLSPEQAREWARAFAGKTPSQLEEVILPAFDRIVAEYHQLPEQVILPPAARAKFEEGFQLLQREKEGTDDHR